MAQARHVDMNRLLPLALAVTCGVLLLPLAVVMAALTILHPDPHPLVTSALGLLIAIATTVIGSSLWMRNPQSRDIAFGELMIWGWYRRKRAEDQLLESTRLLGLNRSGDVESGVPLSPREQIEVLRDLSAALEAKDPYTHGHSRRVERHVYRIGLTMGLHVADIEDLRMAASFY